MNTKALRTGALALGLLTGCGKEYLDLQPTNVASTETFYTTPTAAIQATTSVYASLSKRGTYNLSLWIMDIMSDNSVTGGAGGTDGLGFQQVDNFNIPVNNDHITNLWQRCYLGIGAANQVVLRVPGVPGLTPVLLNRCLGEAKFLRALYYFHLVRAYGDVPLVLVPANSAAEASSVRRDPAAAVYTQIEADLTDAIAKLNGQPAYTGLDVGRATVWSARALLAKVYLTQGKLPECVTQAQAVIGNSGKSLWPSYADNFKLANENGQESLFEAQMLSGQNGFSYDGPGSPINQFWGIRGFGNPQVVGGGGFGQNIPEKSFVDGYEPGDTRKAATVFVPGDLYTDGPRTAQGNVQEQPAQSQGSPFGLNIRKYYVGTLSNSLDSPLNIPILRLADVYLMLAEASGPTPVGLEAVNKVRRRAFGRAINTPAPTVDITTTNPVDFKTAVLRERRYELAFEFERWYDLKRTNTLLTNPNLISKGIKPFNVLLPVPQAERDINPNLTQNLGY